jgi:hypothetical protein
MIEISRTFHPHLRIMKITAKPDEWFERRPDEDDYKYRIRYPNDFNLDFTLSTNNRDARLAEEEKWRQAHVTYGASPVVRKHYPNMPCRALISPYGKRYTRKVMSKLEKRIRIKVCFQVEGKYKGGNDHFRTKRVPRPLIPAAK